MSTATRHERDITVSLHVLGDDGPTLVPLEVRLSYDTTDPYAVELAFLKQGITWTVARDLLIDGVQSAAGEGDFRIATYALSSGDVCMVTLDTPSDRCDFSLAADVLIDFLECTEDLVPLGWEPQLISAELDVCRWLGTISEITERE